MASKRKAEAAEAAEPWRATRCRADAPPAAAGGTMAVHDDELPPAYPLVTVAALAASIKTAPWSPLLPPLVDIVAAYADPRFFCDHGTHPHSCDGVDGVLSRPLVGR
jgi:hypothetical protein